MARPNIEEPERRIPDVGGPVPMSTWLRFVAVLLTALVLMLAVSGFSRHNLLLVFAVAALPLALLLLQSPQNWFVLTLGLFYSGLYLPEFPRSFDLFHASAVGLVPVLAASALISENRFRSSGVLKLMSAGFVGVMLVTVRERGFGLSVMSGEMWGGASYVYMMLAFAIFVFGDSLTFSERDWKRVIVLLFLLGLLPALAEMGFLFSRGKFTLPFWVIRHGGGVAERNLDALLGYAQEVFRLKASKDAVFLLVLALALAPYRGKYKRRIWIAGLAAAALVGLSGHRTQLFMLAALVPLVMYFTRRRFPFRLVAASLALFGTVMLVLALWGTRLPLAVQRVVAWMPFADISPIAQQSAAGTLEGRVEMWKTLISDYLPRYWLIGRGFGFSAGELRSLGAVHPRIAAYMITNSYHNGILVLLINLGVGGLLFGYGFLLFGWWRHYRLLRLEWVNQDLARCHRVVLAFYTLTVIAQTAVGGGDWITQPVVLMVVLEGMAVVNRRMLSAPEEPGRTPAGEC